ncbi:MAG: S1C family serine protease [Faecousia sp.]
MDERKHNYTDWDDSVYGTGRTEPPKNRGGLMALLLILIIFLCGIITVLGVLNVKLFHKLQLQEDNELAISFTTAETEPVQTEPIIIAESVPSGDPVASMELQQSPAGVDSMPAEGGLSLQEIYARNIDCVVSITCTLTGGSSSGTGVIFSDKGYIVTNAHVVDDAIAVTVQLTDDRIFPADIIGMDEISDLAVLYIEADGLTPAQFGDSSTLQVGDTVVAIGDPLGVKFRGTCTNGIISAINRDVDVDGHTMTLIQTNAALNSGNSGGPLINCYGQVIGINTMKIGAFSDQAGVEGIGFAIPSTTVKDIVDQLISQGYVSGRPTLGIEGESLALFYQHYYRLPAGLYITQVDRFSDAYAKGVDKGDILISIEDNRITSMNEMKSAIYDYEIGDTVQVVIYRGGQQYQLELTLTEDQG